MRVQAERMGMKYRSDDGELEQKFANQTGWDAEDRKSKQNIMESD